MARVQSIEVTAVEIDAALSALAAENAVRNGFAAHFEVVNADVTSPGRALAVLGLNREAYDHVIANPPFHAEGRVRPAPDQGRASAHVMGDEDLASWIRFFAAMAAPGALLTLIHRPDTLRTLLELLDGRFGDLCVFPLFPRRAEPATRIILQGKKGSRAGLNLLPGLVLHAEDGSYTPEADSVLRGGEALDLRSAQRKGHRPGG
jgi:tRNA1(Val) A37 N6-methylase TrmN6